MKIKNHTTARVTLSSSDDVLTITKTGSIHLRNVAADLYAILGTASASDSKITVNGYVGISGSGANATGIISEGTGTTIKVGATGLVNADRGISIAGDSTTLVNNGTIAGTRDRAVLVSGQEATVINKGLLAGDVQFGLSENSSLINQKGASILGTVYSSRLIEIDNMGFISGDLQTYSGLRLTNTGTIKGAVVGLNDKDVVDTRGGKINGDIELFGGDDVLITDRATHLLKENPGGGFDTVKSSVTYTLSLNVEQLILLGKKNINGRGTDAGDDVLRGNSGNNKLEGLGGADVLDGGKGNDRLIGGPGADTFVFATGYGKDRILDFENGQDWIYVADLRGINNFNQLKSHISQHGDDVWISVGRDRLIIDDIQKADLDAGDFVF